MPKRRTPAPAAPVAGGLVPPHPAPVAGGLVPPHPAPVAGGLVPPRATRAPAAPPAAKPLAYSGPDGHPAHIDADAIGIMERAQRLHACEQAVFAALFPILAEHHCKLGTLQEIIDGQPGPIRIVVMALD